MFDKDSGSVQNFDEYPYPNYKYGWKAEEDWKAADRNNSVNFCMRKADDIGTKDACDGTRGAHFGNNAVDSKCEEHDFAEYAR
jgi:hypothetical protein